MKYMYLFVGLITLGLCVVCVTYKTYQPLPGLLMAVALFFNWLHAAELADHFNHQRPKQPLVGILSAALMAFFGLLWSATK